MAVTNGEVGSSEDQSAPKNLPMDGAEWVELFVREIMSASNMDDARARASRALEVLEKSISARASAEAAQSIHQVVICCFCYCCRPGAECVHHSSRVYGLSYCRKT